MASLRLRTIVQEERGAQLVEFALVLPLLLLVLLGIVDFGLLFHRYEVLTNAAREGARLAILPDYSDSDARNRVLQYLQASGLNDEATIVPVGPIDDPATCITLRGISVTYPHNYLLLDSVIGLFGENSLTAGNLTATTYMRSERAMTCAPP